MKFNKMILALKEDSSLFAFRRGYIDGYGDTPMLNFHNGILVQNRIEAFYHRLIISHRNDYPFHDNEYDICNWELWKEEDILEHIKKNKEINKWKFIIV